MRDDIRRHSRPALSPKNIYIPSPKSQEIFTGSPNQKPKSPLGAQTEIGLDEYESKSILESMIRN